MTGVAFGWLVTVLVCLLAGRDIGLEQGRDEGFSEGVAWALEGLEELEQ